MTTSAQKPPSKYGRVLRFVTHYWLLSPALFGTLVVARIFSTLIDVTVPVASGRVVDAIASGSRENPGPALWALTALLGLVALFQLSRQSVTFLLNRMSARAITAIGRDAFAYDADSDSYRCPAWETMTRFKTAKSSTVVM